MSSSQNKKSKFRSSKKWKDFRKVIYQKAGGLDEITGKKLRAGWNVHHLDMRESHYTDLDNINHFLALNKTTHSFWHDVYRYWVKDRNILNRLEDSFERSFSISTNYNIIEGEENGTNNKRFKEMEQTGGTTNS